MEGETQKNQKQYIIKEAAGKNDTGKGAEVYLPFEDISDRHYRLRHNESFIIDRTSAEVTRSAPASACIRDIFLHGEDKYQKLKTYIISKKELKTDFKEKLLIYPNMVEIREINKLHFSQNNQSNGKKGIIKEFSKKSRREFIKFLCKIADKLVLWVDVTFSDDVMRDKAKRKDTSNKVLNRFRRIVLKKYPEIKIVYKREWVPRKSGNLKGEYIPHFHMFISVSEEKAPIFTLARALLRIWVACTQTQEIEKALSVALHTKSYRLIINSKQAIKYGSKYISKPTENWTEETIGRSWGTIGKFNMPDPQVTDMTPSEMVLMKRRFRKSIHKKHPLQKALRKRETPTFLIIQQNTVNRLIEHTQKMLEDDCFAFFDGLTNDER